MKTGILTVLVFFFVSFAGICQSPKSFNFQAVARDAAGQPMANTEVTLQLDIRQGNLDGTVVYSESFTTVTNELGFIQVQVGQGMVLSGSMSGINWGGDKHYMETSVDGTVLGTVQLLSVPYSLYADEAGNTFSGSFGDLKNVPAGLEDGDDDTRLTESEVDAFTDNNGYLTSEVDPGFEASPASEITSQDISNWNNKSDFSGDYNDLTNKPDLENTLTVSVLGDTLFINNGNHVRIPGISAANPRWGARVAGMNYARSDLGCVVMNGKIWAAGGTDGTNHFDYFEVYDPETNSWETKAPMQMGRSKHGIAEYDNKIMVFGGYTSTGTTSTVEQYDPTTNSWSYVAEMPENIRGATVAVVQDEVFVLGGKQESHLSYNQVYLPAQDTWELRTSLPSGRAYIFGSATYNNNIYLCGGNSDNPEFTSTTLIYNTVSDTWSSGDNMSLARGFHGITQLNGNIYVLGGAVDGWVGTTKAEVYSISENSWSDLPDMPQATWAYGIVNYQGNIFIIGGDDGTQRLNTVQVFRPE